MCPSSPPTARLRIHPPERRPGGTTWVGRLEIPGRSIPPVRFDFSHPEDPRAPSATRPFVLAFLPVAMRVGARLVVEEPLDAGTLANLMEWQAIWADWRPHRLRVVPLEAPIEEAPPPPATVAARAFLSAFSGGVDSCFTVWRQTRGATVGRRIPIRAGLFVRGFDIACSEEAASERAFVRARDILAGFGHPLWSLTTNVRDLERACDLDWETETHGIWLAATLACLEPWYDGFVIPSTFTYDCLRLPWGSNPIGDPLLGSASRPCWHDGAEHTKLSKVESMAGETAIAAGLRVCYSGEQPDQNCGRCYKCVTTQVSFWLAGIERPPAFAQPGRLEDVAAVPVEFEQHDYLIGRLIDRARVAGRRDLVRALEQARARGLRERRRRRRRARARRDVE